MSSDFWPKRTAQNIFYILVLVTIIFFALMFVLSMAFPRQFETIGPFIFTSPVFLIGFIALPSFHYPVPFMIVFGVSLAKILVGKIPYVAQKLSAFYKNLIVQKLFFWLMVFSGVSLCCTRILIFIMGGG